MDCQTYTHCTSNFHTRVLSTYPLHIKFRAAILYILKLKQIIAV